jgi:outer membrane lipoprotein-sorting protein
MARFLRTTSTRRLLALIAGLCVAIVAGAAIAVAAQGPGPVPKHKSLASAIRSAMAAPAVPGISARISFTNHLIDASALQGADPLLQGASGRLWLSGNHQLRLELQSANGDAQVIVNNGSFTIYDPASNTVYEGTLPAHMMGSKQSAKDSNALPSIAEIQKDINHLAQHLDLSGAIPSDVAGQPTYTVKISPKHDGGLLGAAEVAWDAVRGVPLRIAVYARGDKSPVLELKATDISYGSVPSSDFAFTPPPGTKIVTVATPKSQAAPAHRGRTAADKRERASREVSGVAAVAKHVPFKLSAPHSLVGLNRRSVTLLDWNHSPAALVFYGQGIGGIAVIEQTAAPGSNASQSSSGGPGLSLPTVSIKGATGQELDTALGTMIRFTRGGVTYTVIGSIPPTAAELAARKL